MCKTFYFFLLIQSIFTVCIIIGISKLSQLSKRIKTVRVEKFVKRKLSMFYKSIPVQFMQQLREPLESVTADEIAKRLNKVFGLGKWQTESTHQQLFGVSLPLVGPRGMEIHTSLTLWLTKNIITVPVGDGETTSRTSYVLGPFLDDEDRLESEKLAFINTACRVMGVGMAERTQILSLESGVIGRKMFISERIEDFIVDDLAIKVILETKEKNNSDRRDAPRTEVSTLGSIPAAITIDRTVQDVDFFMLDFSSSGLKIVSPFNFPEDRPFNLTLKFEEPITLWCEVVWKSEMWKNIYHVGIKFMRLQLDKFEKLCHYIEDFLPSRGYDSFRLNRVLPAEFMLWSTVKRLPTFFHSISTEKMSVIFPAFLQKGMNVTARIYPFSGNVPIECVFEVETSRVLKGGGCQATLVISEITQSNQERLESFIRHCVMEERRAKQANES